MFPGSIFHAGGAQGPAGATGAAGPANLGVSVLAGNVTNNTATMAATGLSVPVTSGHRYAFRAILMLNDSSTGQLAGAKLDFDASTATFTNFRCWFGDGQLAAFTTTSFVTSPSTDILNGTPFLDSTLVIEGGFEPSSTGTLAIRMAEQGPTDGTLTLYRDSSLTVWEPA